MWGCVGLGFRVAAGLPRFLVEVCCRGLGFVCFLITGNIGVVWDDTGTYGFMVLGLRV